MSCDCRSHNWEIGSVPEVALTPPERVQATRVDPERLRPVAVDACIAGVVQALWDAGFTTLGSCCGHGRQGPNLVIGKGHGDDDIARMVAVLRSVDDRSFLLLQWQWQIVEVARS